MKALVVNKLTRYKEKVNKHITPNPTFTMYIVNALMFAGSLGFLVMGILNLTRRKSATEKELDSIWRVRDELLIDSDVDEPLVENDYHEIHREVLRELRRDFFVLEYVNHRLKPVLKLRYIDPSERVDTRVAQPIFEEPVEPVEPVAD